MKKEKLAVIGAGEFQIPLIRRAKEMGMEAHVFAWACGDPGEREADYFYPVSITEKEKILEACRKIQPAGVASIASDLAVPAVNYAAEKLGLAGNGTESTLSSTNKYWMRRAFAENGDPSPKCLRSDELSEENVGRLKMPLVVKPVDRSGSRGVCRITERRQLETAVREAERISFERKAVVEEFVEGQEYSAEYMSWQGRHHFLALTEKHTTGAPHFIETGHVQPAAVPAGILHKICRTVEHALDSLQVRTGASHSEIMVSPQGDVMIIEIGARMGGDFIGSDLVQISTGYDYVGMVIDAACGREPSFRKTCTPQRAQVRFILNGDDFAEFEKIRRERPECIYRAGGMQAPFDGARVLDSSGRHGYYIMRGQDSACGK